MGRGGAFGAAAPPSKGKRMRHFGIRHSVPILSKLTGYLAELYTHKWTIQGSYSSSLTVGLLFTIWLVGVLESSPTSLYLL